MKQRCTETTRPAEVFIPDKRPLGEAICRVKWMCIGAHPDDIELLAPHAIWECRSRTSQKHFVGVVVTHGAGMLRSPSLKRLTRQEITVMREREQKAAARLGKYSALFMLGRESRDLCSARVFEIVEQLLTIFRMVRPQYVITHQLMDTHPTHVGVALAVVKALRGLPQTMRPQKLFGVEVWGGLDWIPERHRQIWLLTGAQQFHERLVRIFGSQKAAGKAYADAAVARARAHATFLSADRPDPAEEVIVGLDMTRLIRGRVCDPQKFVCDLVVNFVNETLNRIGRLERAYQYKTL